MEKKELLLNYGLEVEEYCPTACIPNKIRRQSAVEALDRMLLCCKLFEDTESADGSFGGVAVDWDMLMKCREELEEGGGTL